MPACHGLTSQRRTGNVMNASHPLNGYDLQEDVRCGASQIFGIKVPMMGMNYVPPTGDSTNEIYSHWR